MLMTPILPERSGDCRRILRRFNERPASPLAELPDVHFARWVVIDHVHLAYSRAPKQPSKLSSEYLLFSADLTPPAYRVDRLPGSFFRDLARYIPAECQAVWENCRGFPGLQDVDGFVAYLEDSQIEIDLYFAAFADLTPAEILNALEFRRQFAQFVFDNQSALSSGTANAQLQRDYMRDSASWGI